MCLLFLDMAEVKLSMFSLSLQCSRLKNLKMFVVRSSSVPKKVEHVVVQSLRPGNQSEEAENLATSEPHLLLYITTSDTART